jgi:hypothetical protein
MQWTEGEEEEEEEEEKEEGHLTQWWFGHRVGSASGSRGINSRNGGWSRL